MKKRVKILIMLGATFFIIFGRISDNGAFHIMSYDEYCCGFPARWAFAVPVSGIRVSGLSDLVLPSFKLMRHSLSPSCAALSLLKPYMAL